MEIPIILKNAIEKNVEGVSRKQLSESSELLSQRYKNNDGRGDRLVSTSNEVNAYSIVRMPATYGSVYSALKYTIDIFPETPKSLLDVGAGTGAASWAANSLLDLNSIICLEREEKMISLGKKLMAEDMELCKKVKWIQGDMTKTELKSKADLVVSSYVFNEMSDDDMSKSLIKLWNVTNMLLVIIEPGTVAGYRKIIQARKVLLEQNANIVAPCPSNMDCPIKNDDWCHFSCRIPRGRLHKEIKNGDVPYEDEKFIYIAVSPSKSNQCLDRIIRHPYIEKGKVTVQICTSTGIQKKEVRKKEGEMYKKVRKSKWGDAINSKGR